MIFENENNYNKPNTERRSRITNPTPSGLGKLAPQSVDLEEIVLGAILLESGAIESVDFLSQEMFYKDCNQKIFGAIKMLVLNKTPIDLATVTSQLRKIGELEMIGGMYYLTELTSRVGSGANIEFHARIIQQKFIQRELIRIATDTIQSAYEDTTDVLSLLDLHFEHIDNLRKGIFTTSEKTSKDLANELRQEQLREKKNGLLGISTGLIGLDKILKGDCPGDVRMIAAATSMGKAQPLTAKVLTPNGFVEIGKLKIEDVICNSSGGIQKVTGIFPQGIKQTYRIKFNDSTETRCCNEHLWLTLDRGERRYKKGSSVKSLKQIRETLTVYPDKRKNHAIEFVEPVFFSKKQLPIHPYVLGVLLGDGCLSHLSISNPEIDIIDRTNKLLPKECELRKKASKRAGCPEYRIARKEGEQTNPIIEILKKLGLHNLSSSEKIIPPEYLGSSFEDRLELLRGLLDTDGFVVDKHCIEFSTTSKWIKTGIIDLVRSLGGRATFKEKTGKYKKDGIDVICKQYYRMNISFTSNEFIPVTSKKHTEKYQFSKRQLKKFITEIVKDEKEECVCISVSGDDKLYVTDDYILTHNTAVEVSEVINCCFDKDKNLLDEQTPVVVFNLEMSSLKFSTRLLSDLSSIEKDKISSGRLDDYEKDRYEKYLQLFEQSKIFIEDCTELTIDQFEIKIRSLVKKHGIKKAYIDTIQLMKGNQNKRYATRELELSDIGRTNKAIAKKYGITIIELAQLNDDLEPKRNYVPQLKNIRECKALGHDADNVMFVWRPDYYEDVPDILKSVTCSLFGNEVIHDFKNMGFFIIAKNREGTLGKIPFSFKGEISRVSDHFVVKNYFEGTAPQLTTESRTSPF